MSAHTEHANAFPPAYVASLQKQILASRHLTANALNRDFVGTRGFSVVFRRESIGEVERVFPYFKAYLERALREDCNAFYLNPLLLEEGSRVDPHIDRSLRAYCKTVVCPAVVSVLYVAVPPGMRGGELVLQRGRKHLARIKPVVNTLLFFGGDLTHSIDRLEGRGTRTSLVCEQYCLTPEELEQIPGFTVESRARAYD